jgi:hypothetical protein
MNYRMIGGDGKQYGPISGDQLRQWRAEGRVVERTQIQAEGSADWKPLSAFPELAGPAPVTPPANVVVNAAAPVKTGTSGLAIASLVLGCLGFCSYGVTSIVGLILGIIGLRQIKRSDGALGGKGLAIAGIATSGVSLLIMPALIAALAIPGFMKAKNQSQGRRIINDARQMDAAIDQWALEKGKQNGAPLVTPEIATYLKGNWNETDLLGNPYLFGPVGPQQIKISPATKEALDGTGIDWGAY